MSKNARGGWTLANRVIPETVLKTLWTTGFTPDQFKQSSSCATDDREIKTQSALAVRHGDSITITLYPFRFSQADLDYWRQASGLSVREEAVAGSHFNDSTPAVCRLVVKIDKTNQLSLQNVGFDDPTSSPARSTLWQPSKADVSRLALEQDAINVVTAGAIATTGSGFRWNVKIKIPVWQRGL